jgi:autotransporter translocation and assembly factor TamB
MTWQGIQLERLAGFRELSLAVPGGLNGRVRARGTWPGLQAEVLVQRPHLTAYGLEIADLQLQAQGARGEHA